MHSNILQTQLYFQDNAMISVNPIDKYWAFHLLVLQFEACRCRISIENTENSMVDFSPGHTVAYLNCRLKGCSLPWYTICENTNSMLNHTYMPDGMLHGTLIP